jgi:hypothetical protein
MEGSMVIIQDEELLNGSISKDTADLISSMSDEELSKVSFSVPWQYSASNNYNDPDGFEEDVRSTPASRKDVQAECWNKSIENPQINTHVRGMMGRTNGFGFEVTSEVPKIQEAIEEIELDHRNRLYNYYSKFTARAHIEGELFLNLTPHLDGFVEVDFIDPVDVDGSADDGIIYHPTKTTMPLFYFIKGKLVPSIFIARYPELVDVAKQDKNFSSSLISDVVAGGKYKKLGGFKRFVISWDRSFLTKRNTSHLRTTLKWLNHYENLKLYEIDHKKSSGAYVWVVTIEDIKTFRLWASLTDEQRRATGIAAKKTPGSTLVLPPGMKLEARNPQLPKISDSDTDILAMISSGLNEPTDVTMGSSNSPFASVKASRGPMSDRVSDEISYYEKFLRYDFWGSIFFLKSKLSDFPSTFKVREAQGFKKIEPGSEKDPEPIFEYVQKKPEQLIEINFPTSEVVDAETRARAYLGVKHGSIVDTLGIPASEVAKRLGFGNYGRLRLRYETEKLKYPELLPTIDAESLQESTEAEPARSTAKAQKGASSGEKSKGTEKKEAKTSA